MNRKYSMLIIVILIFQVKVFSISSNRIAVEKTFKQENKISFKLSPDGNYISYIEKSGLNNILMIEDIQRKNKIKLIYSTNDRIFEYFWINNDQLILSRMSQKREFKIYSIDIRTKKKKYLTRFTKFANKIVFVNSKNGNEIMISTKKSEVYRININTEEKVLVYKNPKKRPVIYKFFADNSGKLRLGRTYDNIILFDPKKNDFEKIISLKLEERFYPRYFSKDNNFVYAYSSVGRDKSAIVKYDLINKKVAKILLEDPDYSIYSFEERNDKIISTSDFYYSYEKQKLIYAYYCTDKFKNHIFDNEFRSISEILKNKIGDYVFSIESFSKSLDKCIIKVFNGKIKGLFYILDRKTKSLKFIHKLNDWMDEKELFSSKPVKYQARDGLTIHGYVTKPDVKGIKKFPVVACIHGGPSLRDTQGYNDITQLLVSKGYLVFQINYRGSRGYGQSFIKSGYKQWGRKINDDIEDGINWLIKKGLVDKSKIAIYGFSSGGHAALAGIINNPDLFTCSISVSGNVNLVSSFGLFSKGFQFKWGDPEKDKLMLTKNSALFNLEKIKTPLMMVNGKKDTSIPIEEVDDFVNKLELQGNVVEYMRYENEGHVMIYKTDIKRDVFEKILDFLEKHMNRK